MRKKKVKCKTCHEKNEKKGEFGSPRKESLCFKGGTLIMLGPISTWTNIICDYEIKLTLVKLIMAKLTMKLN